MTGPKISVIIPTKNRCDILKKVLFALQMQDCAIQDFEVIVSDDGSSEKTLLFLKEFQKQTALNMKFLPGPGRSASYARNQAIRFASGEWILFLDSDTIPHSDLVRKHIQRHISMDDDSICLVGQVVMAEELDRPEQARQWEHRKDWNGGDLNEIKWWKYRTGNTSLKRYLWDRVQGFNERLVAAEDTEFAYRLFKLGIRFICDDQLVVTHYHPMNLNEYLEKAELYGQAVAEWYIQNRELRFQLVRRYGVPAPEMPMTKKIRYAIRSMIVNRLTIKTIVVIGRLFRRHWFHISDVLYQCAYRYFTRRSFKKTIAHATLVK
ncbi:glycosyltransferase [candidate division KSB1 bacterium]|nr:glycosyltransferase [candidate division KSB1 bacterium]